jgi:CRP-like cAMP-binding protein
MRLFTDSHVPLTNRLLASLPTADCERLAPHLSRISLFRGQALYETGKPIEQVYFPTDGIVSLAMTSQDGSDLGAGIVGSEGVVGTGAVLKGGPAITQPVVQVEGSSWQIPTEIFRAEFERAGALRNLVLFYLEALLAQIVQNAVCSRSHTVEERLCHWLLMIRDRVQSGKLELSLDSLARTLGTRCSLVTVAAGVLWKAGLIRFTRDYIVILDRQGLEERACGCYRFVNERSGRRLDSEWLSHSLDKAHICPLADRSSLRAISPR